MGALFSRSFSFYFIFSFFAGRCRLETAHSNWLIHCIGQWLWSGKGILFSLRWAWGSSMLPSINVRTVSSWQRRAAQKSFIQFFFPLVCCITWRNLLGKLQTQRAFAPFFASVAQSPVYKNAPSAESANIYFVIAHQTYSVLYILIAIPFSVQDNFKRRRRRRTRTSVSFARQSPKSKRNYRYNWRVFSALVLNAQKGGKKVLLGTFCRERFSCWKRRCSKEAD